MHRSEHAARKLQATALTIFLAIALPPLARRPILPPVTTPFAPIRPLRRPGSDRRHARCSAPEPSQAERRAGRIARAATLAPAGACAPTRYASSTPTCTAPSVAVSLRRCAPSRAAARASRRRSSHGPARVRRRLGSRGVGSRGCVVSARRLRCRAWQWTSPGRVCALARHGSPRWPKEAGWRARARLTAGPAPGMRGRGRRRAASRRRGAWAMSVPRTRVTRVGGLTNADKSVAIMFAEPPSRRAAEPPSRRAAEPPSRRAAEPPSRRAAEPPSRRAAEPPSRRAAEPPSRRAAGDESVRRMAAPGPVAVLPA